MDEVELNAAIALAAKWRSLRDKVSDKAYDVGELSMLLVHIQRVHAEVRGIGILMEGSSKP
jgi:hypothetical protein